MQAAAHRKRSGPFETPAKKRLLQEAHSMSSSTRHWSPGGFFLLFLLCSFPCIAGEPDKSKLAGIPARMQQFVDQKIIAGAVTLVGTHDQILSLESVGSQVLESGTPMS